MKKMKHIHIHVRINTTLGTRRKVGSACGQGRCSWRCTGSSWEGWVRPRSSCSCQWWLVERLILIHHHFAFLNSSLSLSSSSSFFLPEPAKVTKMRAINSYNGEVTFEKGATVFAVGDPDAEGFYQVSKKSYLGLV